MNKNKINLKDLILKNERIYAELFLLSMFEYDNLPYTLWDEFIELNLIKHGQVGIGYITDQNDGVKKLVAVDVSTCGQINQYAIGTEIIGATPIGTFSGTIGVDTVLGWNNAMRSPCEDVDQFAEIKSDIVVSEKLNVIYSRLLPILTVTDKKQKNAVSDILKRLIDGDIGECVVSDNIATLIDGVPTITSTQISDVQMSQYIQYLSRYNDDVNKRFFTRYGHALQTQNKSAQQTNDEIHGMDSTSWVIPVQMLKYRKRMVDEINRLFDTNITVSFSEVWQREFDKYMGNVKSEDESELETADSSADDTADSSADNGEGSEE